MEIALAYDGTVYMENSIKEIATTFTETVAIVGLIVFLFLGSARSALVPLVTIPISLIGAMAAMMAMGFSLNLLTLLAIVLSVGLVVDDAIVVVENVSRYMRDGMGRIEAALLSTRQLFGPIVAMTHHAGGRLCADRLSVGPDGVLFKEFAFTLATAVIVSGFVAITLSPIMSAYTAPEGGHESRYARFVGHALRPHRRRSTGGCSTPCLRLRASGAGLRRLRLPAGGAALHVLRQGTGAGRGRGLHLAHRQLGAGRLARLHGRAHGQGL